MMGKLTGIILSYRNKIDKCIFLLYNKCNSPDSLTVTFLTRLSIRASVIILKQNINDLTEHLYLCKT